MSSRSLRKGIEIVWPLMQRILRSNSKVLGSSNTTTEALSGEIVTNGTTYSLSRNKIALSANEPERSPRKRARLTTPPAQTTDHGVKMTCTPGKTSGSKQVAKTSKATAPGRRVEPHSTNATLKTPGGTKLVPFAQKFEEASPTRPGQAKSPMTTENLLEQAYQHLISIDPRLKPLIEKHPCSVFSPEGLAEEVDPFQSLVSGIMSQQVSGAAAKSIKQKFINLFKDPNATQESGSQRFPKPDEIAARTIPFLRQAGLSERKAEYIKGLSEKFCSGELSAQMLMNASDEEVLEKLTAVRGLGKWSVEMFSCFSLKRMDIISTGDLGVQ